MASFTTFRYRDILRKPEDLHIPSRPVIEAAQVLDSKKLFLQNGSTSSSSAVYRISLGNLHSGKVATTYSSSAAATAKGIYSTSSTSENEVVQLEVFSCVQKVNCSVISRWKLIALVDVWKNKQQQQKQEKMYPMSPCHTRRFSLLKKSGTFAAAAEAKNSVKIAGFHPGYRYLVAVRSVDAKGRRSLFSRPVVIVPEEKK